MSHAAPECFAYPSHIAFFSNRITELPIIPSDWALNITNIASEWVEQQFLAHIADRPLVEPPAKLDAVTLLSCGQLALRMADAYKHPGEFIGSSPGKCRRLMLVESSQAGHRHSQIQQGPGQERVGYE
jgi:hypothetical protein